MSPVVTEMIQPKRTPFDYVCIGFYAVILVVLSPVVLLAYAIGRGVVRLAAKHGYDI